MTMVETPSTGTEWTMRSRYETADGDRVALLYAPEGGRFAVSYSYVWSFAPQFIEYTSRLEAHKAFAVSLESAERRGVVKRKEG
ncbi:hypothetical protein AB0E62_00465 [Streptomyces sp. NPDC038707]|uniref:hypothetical protein n=1 Tax=Streptomyces sp. NPDC038707 TaxID=3154329 RepID=UPI00340DFEB6